MMMMNMRGTLWCIFGILFIFTITSAAFAQQEQQPDTVPADSQVKQDPLTEINKTLKELNNNYHKLDIQVRDLNTKVTFLLWAFGLFFTVIVLPVIVKYWRNTLGKQNSANTGSRVDSKTTPDVATEKELDPSVFLRQGNFREKTQSDSSILEVKPDDRR